MKNTLTSVFAIFAALILAGCPTMMHEPAPVKNTGTGTLNVELLGVNDARTLLPQTPEFSHYELSFIPLDGQAAHADISTADGSRSIIPISGLAAGRWTINARGYVYIGGVAGIADGEYQAAEGSAEAQISGTAVQTVSIDLQGGVQPGTQGVLSYTARGCETADSAVLRLTKLNGEALAEINLLDQMEGGIALESGYYMAVMELNGSGGSRKHVEIAHIYGNMTTQARFYGSGIAAFSNLADLQTYLKALPQNTAGHPFPVTLYGVNIEYFNNVYNALQVGGKYVSLDLKDCTGQALADNSGYYGKGFLSSLTLPDSLSSIGDSAFSYCTSLTSITLPDSLTSIGSSAFYGCSSLTSITLPDSLSSISSSAFYYCSSLVFQVSGSGKYTTSADGKMLFDGMTLLTAPAVSGSVIVPEGIISIGNYAFINCSSLTSITLPDSLSSIGNYAFYGCTSLNLVTCNTVTPPSVGSEVFLSSALAIKVPDSSVQAYKSAWRDYASRIVPINSVTQTFTSIAELSIFLSGAEAGYIYDIVLTGIDIETGMALDSDPLGALYAALNGKFVNLDLSGCQGQAIPDVDFSIADRRQNKRNIVSIILPQGITSIGDIAFINCSSLTSITLPDTLSSIGNIAFYGCSSLTSITLPDTLLSIGGIAFYDCSSLASITLPDSLTSIGDFAFYGCYSLVFQVSGSGKYTTSADGKMLFDGMTLLTAPAVSGSVIVPEGITSINSSAFYGCSSLTSITLPDSLSSIGDSAFSGCSSLVFQTGGGGTYSASADGKMLLKGTVLAAYPSASHNIVIPYGITTIGNGAFYGCTSLTSVALSNSLTSIGLRAFDGCISLSSITLPNSLTSIGDFAFNGCTSLTSITLPNSLASIGDSAFYGCTSLASVTLPNSLTSIGYSAFSGCSSLTSITLPNSLASIGNHAFYGCSSLISVISNKATPPISSGAFSPATANWNFLIKVPAGSVAAYQAASGWSDYKDYIVALDN